MLSDRPREGIGFMTYRNKLRLKRLLIALAILLGVIALVLLIGFTYLGRYVVYTEDGAYFSFHTPTPAVSDGGLAVSPPQSPVLVTGASIQENSAFEEEGRIYLRASEVQGLMIDYQTLQDVAALNAIDLTEGGYNTLVLEMRTGDSPILNTEAVQTLISRAREQEMQLVAMISCLNDNDYALSHVDAALRISGGALWQNADGFYYLDPTEPLVEDYLVSMISTLTDMGFQEVILDHYDFPDSPSIVYDAGDSTRDALLQAAYASLEEAVGIRCTLGLLIRDPSAGHQAFDLAEHLYVCFSDGSGLLSYVEEHPDYYMVFLTDSHDTRFDGLGKITTPSDFSTSAASEA